MHLHPRPGLPFRQPVHGTSRQMGCGAHMGCQCRDRVRRAFRRAVPDRGFPHLRLGEHLQGRAVGHGSRSLRHLVWSLLFGVLAAVQ